MSVEVQPDQRGIVHPRVRRGVYFLANDHILDLTITFLNSFRAHNPFSDLCLIPFDNDIDRLTELADTYGFDIYRDEIMLQRADALGELFFEKHCGQFRKLCAFEGQFDEFIYIDCDTIVLHDVYFTFQLLDHYDFVASHSDAQHLQKWVWKATIHDAGLLDREQIEFSANTGYFCSRKGLLTMTGSEHSIESSREVWAHFQPCWEQAALNFLVVTSGARYTSLCKLNRDSSGWRLPLERWAGSRDGMLSAFSRRKRHAKPDPLLIHWAGSWSPLAIEWKLYRHLKALGFRVKPPRISCFLRNNWLWKHYREIPAPQLNARRDPLPYAQRSDARPDHPSERE